jgi:hypothetical protein
MEKLQYNVLRPGVEAEGICVCNNKFFIAIAPFATLGLEFFISKLPCLNNFFLSARVYVSINFRQIALQNFANVKRPKNREKIYLFGENANRQ